MYDVNHQTKWVRVKLIWVKLYSRAFPPHLRLGVLVPVGIEKGRPDDPRLLLGPVAFLSPDLVGALEQENGFCYNFFQKLKSQSSFEKRLSFLVLCTFFL